jgi:hypothetical protein
MYNQTFKKGGKNWISGVVKGIKKRGTEGVCTGAKFGGPSCPEGSKRYNLAKTFKAMAKKKKGQEGLQVGGSYGLNSKVPAMSHPFGDGKRLKTAYMMSGGMKSKLKIKR